MSESGESEESEESGVLSAPAGDPAAAPGREAMPSPAQGEGRSRVVLAGATGYIGRPLTSLLHESGHQVAVLTRNAAQAGGLAPGVETVQWDGRTASGSWTAALEGAQAIVNLSGANMGWFLRWGDIPPCCRDQRRSGDSRRGGAWAALGIPVDWSAAAQLATSIAKRAGSLPSDLHPAPAAL
jgi:NAD(P)-dependent dehydrogenase (short-subunit alcohol dehydrogenase family)